jgi:hypothetical protein
VSSVGSKQQNVKMSWRQIFIREFTTRYKTRDKKKTCLVARADKEKELYLNAGLLYFFLSLFLNFIDANMILKLSDGIH